MRRYGFMDRNIEPEALYSRIKAAIEKRGFVVTSEEIQDGYWDLHAKKSGLARIASGSVRDVDLILAGNKTKLSIQLHAGIWGRDFVIPAIEGGVTLGLAAAAEMHYAGKFEEDLWEEIVRMIDPSFIICRKDGRVFESQGQFDEHEREHERNKQQEMEQMTLSRTFTIGWI